MAATTQNTRLAVEAPAAGQVVVLPAVPGQDFVLGAAFDQAELRMDGGNVVLEFPDGGRVVLDFTDLGDAQAPGVVMPDGTVLDMQEFLAALGETDIEPAAGPEGGAEGSGGVGEYRDDAGNLLEGVNKLGGLDPREFTSISVESLDADPLPEDDAPVPPGPTPPPPPTPPTPPVLGPVVTQVEESSLDEDEGQWPGSNESGTLDSASGTIPFAPGSEGGDQLFISGLGDPVDVTDGGTVNGAYGTLVVTLNPDGTYSYTYTLNGNIDHPVPEEDGGTDGRFDDDSLPDVFVMQVVNDGSIIATSTLTVNVLDDGPAITMVEEPDLFLRTEDSYLPGGSSEQSTNTASAPVGGGAVFQVVFGADGPKLVPFNDEYSQDGDPSLQYSFGELNGVDSGLKDLLTGEPILLYTDEDGQVIGRVASLTDSEATFTLTISGSGLVTLTQLRPIMHDRPEDAVDGSDEVQFLTAEELVVNIRAIDGDDDSATESFSLAGLIAFGDDDIVTAEDDMGRVTFGEGNEIRFAISNVLFLVDEDGDLKAYKIDDYENLFDEMKDPNNPQGFVEWVEAQTGGTVTAYFIKAGQLFYDSQGSVVDPEFLGLGDYLTGNGNTFGGPNVVTLEPSLGDFDSEAPGFGDEYGMASGNVLDNDVGSADGIRVSGVSNDGGETWHDIDEGGAVSIDGAYGTLTLYADGTYDYTLNDSGQYGPQDVFTYQVEDGDGDQSSADLTIGIASEITLETMLVPNDQIG